MDIGTLLTVFTCTLAVVAIERARRRHGHASRRHGSCQAVCRCPQDSHPPWSGWEGGQKGGEEGQGGWLIGSTRRQSEERISMSLCGLAGLATQSSSMNTIERVHFLAGADFLQLNAAPSPLSRSPPPHFPSRAPVSASPLCFRVFSLVPPCLPRWRSNLQCGPRSWRPGARYCSGPPGAQWRGGQTRREEESGGAAIRSGCLTEWAGARMTILSVLS